MRPQGRLEAESEAGQGLLLCGRSLSLPDARAREGGAVQTSIPALVHVGLGGYSPLESRECKDWGISGPTPPPT